jgi:hypothetical protein
MRKEYDFSKATRNPYARLLKRDVPTVTLNIKWRFFAEILGWPRRKSIEHREIKAFWDRRLRGLSGKRFKLRLLNGMIPPVPEATIAVRTFIRNTHAGKYELHLGRVLCVKHWNRKRERPA